MLRGRSASSEMLIVSSVPEIHRAFGARGQNVVMVASKLQKVISDHKELSPQDLMDLPHLIENPVFIIRQHDDKQTGDLLLVTDRTASNGDPTVVSIKRQGRDSSGLVATIAVTVYPIDWIKQTVLSAQESNNLLYIRGVRRGPTGYKHTGASYLNASLTDTFNKLRVNVNMQTPRTTFNSGNPPSLISTKDFLPALQTHHLWREQAAMHISPTGRYGRHCRPTKAEYGHGSQPVLPLHMIWWIRHGSFSSVISMRKTAWSGPSSATVSAKSTSEISTGVNAGFSVSSG